MFMPKGGFNLGNGDVTNRNVTLSSFLSLSTGAGSFFELDIDEKNRSCCCPWLKCPRGLSGRFATSNFGSSVFTIPGSGGNDPLNNGKFGPQWEKAGEGDSVGLETIDEDWKKRAHKIGGPARRYLAARRLTRANQIEKMLDELLGPLPGGAPSGVARTPIKQPIKQPVR